MSEASFHNGLYTREPPPLTARDREISAFVHERLAVGGAWPPASLIASRFHLGTKSNAERIIARLRMRGVLPPGPGRNRKIPKPLSK